MSKKSTRDSYSERTRKKDKFVPVYDREPVRPKNSKQKQYINAILNHKIILSTGVAGSGKSYIASIMATDALQDPRSPIERIIIARPNEIEGTKSIGFLKGSLNDKMGPLVAPVTEAIKSRMGVSQYHAMLEAEKIELLPLEHIKGRTFNNCFVIIDEAEDIEWSILKTLMLRTGQDCRIIINGDVRQTSISKESGLQKLMDLYDSEGEYMPMAFVDFDSWDYCVRSDECRLFGELFERNGV